VLAIKRGDYCRPRHRQSGEYLKLFDNTKQKNAIRRRLARVTSSNDPAATAGWRHFATPQATCH